MFHGHLHFSVKPGWAALERRNSVLSAQSHMTPIHPRLPMQGGAGSAARLLRCLICQSLWLYWRVANNRWFRTAMLNTSPFGLVCGPTQVQVQVCFTSVDGQVQPLDVALGHSVLQTVVR
jgi:hypothetical protein